ncbi:MAG: NAD-dependent DNA ligase LigA, partial [bacterium]|nr:NAD-dependent DNA ligase LigA [bacterium]
MTKTEANRRIQKLRKEIEHHRYLYHVLDRQEISDAALDSLKHELFQLEQQFPDLITPDSPTQRMGGEPRKEFREVRHRVPMLSLEDAFSEEEIRAWEKRNRKLVQPSTRFSYLCELKMDGLAIALRYRDGTLIQAATRGDGRTGEDVTENIKTIEAIPLQLRGDAPRDVEVRGEVYMTKKAFAELNKRQAAAGGKIYANPRNVAAGSVRQLDSKITASRDLRFAAYDIAVHGEQSRTIGPAFAKHQEEHEVLRRWGFPTNPEAGIARDVEAVEQYRAHWEKKREGLPYEIDGIVVLVDDNALFERLGVVGKAPRGATAYKFAARQATTVVEEIRVQVGRTGALTPVAVLTPVALGGTTVSRATLHNEQEVHRKDIRVGDTVVIQRAGDVIPEVVEALKRLRPKDAKAFHMPSTCPICGSKVVKEEGGAIHRCTSKNCAARQERTIRHFASRAAVDIEGVGPKLIRKLLDEGLIRDAADLYALTEGDLAALERYAEKSAGNVVASIAARKRLPLGRFVYALGI